MPSTVVYLIYLIVTVSIGDAPFPLISIILIASVYGLQALIFIIKREFMLVGWMVVYILSYPVYSFLLPVYSFWRMDDFGWGNTRLVIGEGNNKKVIINEDEKFDDSMIPLKKFSGMSCFQCFSVRSYDTHLTAEYEAEAWETGSRHSEVTGYSASKARSVARSGVQGSRAGSPHSFHPSQSGGDYYRDTNMLDKNTPSMRGPGSNMSHYGGQPTLSQFGLPQVPFMPFGGGPGSVTGSDYGAHPQMPMAMGAMPYQQTGSVYGMMPQGMPMAPRNTVMSLGMFGNATGGSQAGDFAPPMAPGMMQGGGRPMSTFSLATTMNPFAGGPNMSENPSDEELFSALRTYLSTQDLMSITKKCV